MNFKSYGPKKYKSFHLYSPRAFQQFLIHVSRSTLSFVLLVPSEFPRYDHSFNQIIPRFFSSLSLTHYCSYPWVWLLNPDDQMDPRHHWISNFKSQNACFHLVGPFRIAKRPFLGPRFLGTLSKDLCARISNHTDLKNISQSIIIPLEPSSRS